MRAARLLLAAAALALGASLARADGEIRAKVQEALDRGDRTAALAAIDAVLAAPPQELERRFAVEAASAATSLVGGREGNVRAARLLLGALARDPSDALGAYSLAMGLRRKTRDADLDVSIELLLGLVRIYPAEIEFARDLARAYRYAGLVDDAVAQYERIAALAPSDQDARYRLAFLRAQRGEFEKALQVYDELIELRRHDPRPDLYAAWTKADLLLEKVHDLERAEAALVAGRQAAERTENAALREDYLARFEELRGRITEERARRERLARLRRALDRTLAGTALAWAAALGGGLYLLRRARWLD